MRQFKIVEVHRDNVAGNPHGWEVHDENGPLYDAVYTHPDYAQARINREMGS